MASRRGRRSGHRGKVIAREPQSRAWRWTKVILGWGGALALLCSIALFTAVYFAAQNIPTYSSLMSSQVGQTIVVRARDGSELVSLGPSYGEWLDSDEIPRIMKDAMVAVEDRRFYTHPGIDPLGLMRALFVAFRTDDRIEATSTISQQLARNIFLNSNRSLDRKLREGVLALALEWKFSKEQILELYLNKVYFGGGAYGIDSASRRFFDHSARTLSTEEAAIIAGLVKAPSRYSPTADAEAAVERGNVVLGAMYRYGAIQAGDLDRIDLSTVNLRRGEEGQNSARYFTDWALPQLDLLLPGGSAYEPIEVWTTLDPALQRAANAAIEGNTPAGAQGALVSLDRDGAVLAMVGGRDYVESNFNRAVTALRQPGSAWKLFVYLSALEAGYTPDHAVKDAPVTIDGWSPRNSGGGYAGEIDVRTAFAYSKNTVAAQLGNEVGFSNVASMARRFGITTPISTNPAMVLGSSEVRVIDLTRAFASIAAKGESVEPYAIVRVTNASGEELYRHRRARSYQLVPDYVAAGITDLLQTTVATGTGRAAQIGRPVAGKTGTTSSNKDGWFVGFSSGVTTGVWMGRDDARAVPGLQGGTAPARAFAEYMRVAVSSRPVEEFDTELELPQWQLEPDEEYYYGDPADDYYFIDEDGNWVAAEPSERDLADPAAPGQRPRVLPGEGERGGPGQQPPGTAPASRGAPPAAPDDFLERAIGAELPPE